MRTSKLYWCVATDGLLHRGRAVAPGEKFQGTCQEALDGVASGRARFVDPHEHAEAARESTSAALSAEGQRNWLTSPQGASWPTR